MAYKLAEEDKLCGVIYPTYEGFSPIPKATCEMLESKCDELDIEINCGGKKEEKPSESQSVSNSVSQFESTSVPTSISASTSESASSSTENSNTPEEPKPTPEPQPEPVPTPVLTNEELDNIVINKLNSNGSLGKYRLNIDNSFTLVEEPTPEEIEAYKKAITDKVGGVPELEGYTVEVSVYKIPSEFIGSPIYTKVVKITKPNGDVYQSKPMEINKGSVVESTDIL